MGFDIFGVCVYVGIAAKIPPPPSWGCEMVRRVDLMSLGLHANPFYRFSSPRWEMRSICALWLLKFERNGSTCMRICVVVAIRNGAGRWLIGASWPCPWWWTRRIRRQQWPLRLIIWWLTTRISCWPRTEVSRDGIPPLTTSIPVTAKAAPRQTLRRRLAVLGNLWTRAFDSSRVLNIKIWHFQWVFQHVREGNQLWRLRRGGPFDRERYAQRGRSQVSFLFFFYCWTTSLVELN